MNPNQSAFLQTTCLGSSKCHDHGRQRKAKNHSRLKENEKARYIQHMILDCTSDRMKKLPQKALLGQSAKPEYGLLDNDMLSILGDRTVSVLEFLCVAVAWWLCRKSPYSEEMHMDVFWGKVVQSV